MTDLKRHGHFNPTAPPNKEGKVNAALFRCPCGGVMFDVTSRMAEATGVLNHECDLCHARTATKVHKE